MYPSVIQLLAFGHGHVHLRVCSLYECRQRHDTPVCINGRSDPAALVLARDREADLLTPIRKHGQLPQPCFIPSADHRCHQPSAAPARSNTKPDRTGHRCPVRLIHDNHVEEDARKGPPAGRRHPQSRMTLPLCSEQIFPPPNLASKN